MGFNEDLKFGESFECLAKEYYINKNYEITFSAKGYFKEYDFIAEKDDEKLNIEVKADKTGFKTGNLCIEYEHNKKPSCIKTTKADYYCYYLVNKNDIEEYLMYIIPVEYINELINDKKYKRDIKYYNTKFYLFDKSLFEQYLINDNINYDNKNKKNKTE